MKKIITSLLLLSATLLCACGSEQSGSDSIQSGDIASEIASESVTDAETEPEPTVYSVCISPKLKIAETDLQPKVYEFDNLTDARKKADDAKYAALGYAVYDQNGEFIYSKYNEFVSALLAASKHITDYIKKEGYTYGSAAKNPAITYYNRIEEPRRGNNGEKIVSCDRFVGWALYDVGFTDQPTDGGMYVYGNSSNRDHHLGLFLEKYGWTRIEDSNDIQAGDIVFVRKAYANGEMYGAHVFICAGKTTNQRSQYYRYDCGSNDRVNCIGAYASYRSGQPFTEGIGEFAYSYRFNPDKDTVFQKWLEEN